MELVQQLRWQGLQTYRQIMKPAFLGLLYFDRSRIPHPHIQQSLPPYSPKVEQLYPAEILFHTIQLNLRQKLLTNQKQLQKAIKSNDKNKLEELQQDFTRQFENAQFISKGLMRMYKYCLLRDKNKRKSMEKYIPLQILKHLSEQDVGSPLYKQEMIDFFVLLEKKGMSNWKSFFFEKEETNETKDKIIETEQKKSTAEKAQQENVSQHENAPQHASSKQQIAPGRPRKIKKKIKKRTRKFQ